MRFGGKQSSEGFNDCNDNQQECPSYGTDNIYNRLWTSQICFENWKWQNSFDCIGARFSKMTLVVQYFVKTVQSFEQNNAILDAEVIHMIQF